MSSSFEAKKRHILSSLSRDSATYADASPKGSVDEAIRQFVGEINSTEGFVTTSSCSGRIAVFLEGARKPASTNEKTGDDGAPDGVSASAGGKGGGVWLFTSHEKVDLSDLGGDGKVLAHLGLPTDAAVSFPNPSSEMVRYIHFKFEPMILHILSSSPSNGQKCLNAALSAGFRESGISSILDSPMVAVRTSGLAFDCLIGFTALHSSGIQLMVSEEYLHTLICVANERFEINAQRTERFRQALLAQVGKDLPLKNLSDRAGKAEYEPADVRRERKRKDGMERKKALSAQASAVQSNDQAEGFPDEGEEVYDFDMLLTQPDESREE